jgi:hypothetical protein
MPDSPGSAFPVELIAIEELREHPRNYVEHPQDELEHIKASIVEHGIYKNIVIARDSTILAGHGLVKAARQLGMLQLPVLRLDVDSDDPRALKVLTGDNEIMHLRQIDDRALANLFKEIRDSAGDTGAGLLGTGYDDMMLSSLLMVTRPASEIQDHNEAEQWVGMPAYETGEEISKLIVSFRSEDERRAFVERTGVGLMAGGDRFAWAGWYPPKDRNDLLSVKMKGTSE